jgi:broad specificity phosphatase PhoE
MSRHDATGHGAHRSAGPPTVVHMLRHGEVENPAKILYGRLPGFRLSQLGDQMAKAVAAALATNDVTRVVASPLERAQQTADPIASQFGLPVEADDRLIESSNFFEGQRVGIGDGVLRDPRNWWVLRNPFRPSWGESYASIAARMRAVLESVRAGAEGHEVVCVSHQLTIWTLRRLLEGKRLWHDPRHRQCGLASLTSFHFEGTTLVRIGYREPAAHLVARSPGARTARGA